MNTTKTRTGAAEIAPKSTQTVCDSVELAEFADKLTITLAGAALANLRRAVDALNLTDWCGENNTVLSVLDEFVLGTILTRWAEDPAEEAAVIVDGIDTGSYTEREDSARRAALLRAFVRAFRGKGA